MSRWWQEGMPVIRTEEALAAGLSELQPSSAEARTAVKQEPRDDGERGDALLAVDAETEDEENGPSPKRRKDSIHDDTPRRWRVKTPESGAGRPVAIDPGLFTELAQITSTLCSKVGLSADTLLVIWKVHVKALLKRDLDIYISTVRQCMNKMGHAYKKGG